jgi:putative tricarboxylic transport membrane protein
VRLNDAVIGTALIAICAAVVAYTLTFPSFPGQRYGPSLFPRLLAFGIIALSIPLILRGLSRHRGGQAWLMPPAFVADRWRIASFLLVVAGIVAFIIAGETVGFILMAVAILAGLMLWLRVRPWLAALVAVAAAYLMHWFFAVMLRVPLPRGLLTLWL